MMVHLLFPQTTIARGLNEADQHWKMGVPASSPSTPYSTLHILAKTSNDSQIAKGCTGDKPCFVTIPRPDTIIGLPERKLSHTFCRWHLGRISPSCRCWWSLLWGSVHHELSVYCKNHRRVHLWAARPASLQHNSKF
jgi:hypothetical protein